MSDFVFHASMIASGDAFRCLKSLLSQNSSERSFSVNAVVGCFRVRGTNLCPEAPMYHSPSCPSSFLFTPDTGRYHRNCGSSSGYSSLLVLLQ